MSDHETLIDHERRISLMERVLSSHIQKALDDAKAELRSLRSSMNKVFITAIFSILGFLINVVLMLIKNGR